MEQSLEVSCLEHWLAGGSLWLFPIQDDETIVPAPMARVPVKLVWNRRRRQRFDEHSVENLIDSNRRVSRGVPSSSSCFPVVLGECRHPAVGAAPGVPSFPRVAPSLLLLGTTKDAWQTVSEGIP